MPGAAAAKAGRLAYAVQAGDGLAVLAAQEVHLVEHRYPRLPGQPQLCQGLLHGLALLGSVGMGYVHHVQEEVRLRQARVEECARGESLDGEVEARPRSTGDERPSVLLDRLTDLAGRGP